MFFVLFVPQSQGSMQTYRTGTRTVLQIPPELKRSFGGGSNEFVFMENPIDFTTKKFVFIENPMVFLY